MFTRLIFIVGLLGSVVKADDALEYWPQWRGPTWNGVAAHADPPVEWSETENVRWKTLIGGEGKSTPIIWGDRIFLHTAVPLDRQLPIPDVIPPGTPNIREHPDVAPTWKAQRIEIVCIDRISGEPLWRRVVFEGMPHQGHHWKGGFASESPVTDGQYLYSYFGSFGLHCYDFDGELIWRKEFEAQAMEDSLGEGTSPALYGDRVVIVMDQERQSYVVAFDKTTGEEIWRQERDEVSNWSTPTILTYDGSPQVVVNGVIVRSYALSDGEELWQCGGQSMSAVPMPAFGHGLVFAASGWREDTVHAIALGQRGDLTDSENVVWSLDRGAPYVPSPMVWGDEIYLLEDRSFFSCLRAVDGFQYYFKERMPGPSNFSASPVGAADRIYLLTESGKTVVLKRGQEATVLTVNELDDAFYASPAIVGDSIYLRGNKSLYRIAAPVE